MAADMIPQNVSNTLSSFLIFAATRGKAVQVDPMKPMLKAPGTKRLTLNHDTLLSSLAFNSNLRRYSEAGAYTRSHFSST